MSLDGLDETTYTNHIYLTGLGKRNYFDMRAFYFDIQDADTNSIAENQQAIVYPVLDYSYAIRSRCSAANCPPTSI